MHVRVRGTSLTLHNVLCEMCPNLTVSVSSVLQSNLVRLSTIFGHSQSTALHALT